MKKFTSKPTLLEKKFSILAFWFRFFGINSTAVSGALCFASIYFGQEWSAFSLFFFIAVFVGLTLFASSFAMNRIIMRYGNSEGEIFHGE